jgi:hypothetical protein
VVYALYSKTGASCETSECQDEMNHTCIYLRSFDVFPGIYNLTVKRKRAEFCKNIMLTRDHVLALLVEALRYKPEGRGFHSI